MRPLRPLSGQRCSCLLGPGIEGLGGALLVSKMKKTNKKQSNQNINQETLLMKTVIHSWDLLYTCRAGWGLLACGGEVGFVRWLTWLLYISLWDHWIHWHFCTGPGIKRPTHNTHEICSNLNFHSQIFTFDQFIVERANSFQHIKKGSYFYLFAWW